MNKSPTILLADDDASIVLVVGEALRRAGYAVETTDSVPQLLEWMRDRKGDVVITDVLMPSGNGLEALSAMQIIAPHVPVIVISARNALLTAVEATNRGAFDFMAKPFDLNLMVDTVGRALQQRPLPSPAQESHVGQEQLGLVGHSPAMQEIYRILARLVGNDLTVMIEGESGTGKELVAHALHSLSRRKDKPFVAVNMAAIPKDLIESELFGHEKGSFTGALQRKAGKFEQAQGGTLFLDEIGDMPTDAQTKLLRVLQQGEFTPIGGSRALRTDLRIVCATHRKLATHIRNGEFREDLYYRLNVVPLRLPALRDRAEDIPLLANHFLRVAEQRGLPAKQFDNDALDQLQHYPWPGNIRELENLTYRLCALTSQRIIGAAILQKELGEAARNNKIAEANSEHDDAITAPRNSLQTEINDHLYRYFAACEGGLPAPGLYDRMIRLMEKPLIEQTLQATNGNQIKAARILGINRNTLRKKITELKLVPRRSA